MPPGSAVAPNPAPTPLKAELCPEYSRIHIESAESAEFPDVTVQKTMANAVGEIANNLSDILADVINNGGIGIEAPEKPDDDLLTHVIGTVKAVLQNESNQFKGVDTRRIKDLLSLAIKLQKRNPETIPTIKQALKADHKAYLVSLNDSKKPDSKVLADEDDPNDQVAGTSRRTDISSDEIEARIGDLFLKNRLSRMNKLSNLSPLEHRKNKSASAQPAVDANAENKKAVPTKATTNEDKRRHDPASTSQNSTSRDKVDPPTKLEDKELNVGGWVLREGEDPKEFAELAHRIEDRQTG
jgi:hypothetical protein